jgi:putative nucleotidyltransferase with HDIG domain
VRDELLKLMRGPHAGEALRQMVDLHLLAVTLPEIAALEDVAQSPPHHEPVLAHTISVLHRLYQVEGILQSNGQAENTLQEEIWAALSSFATALNERLAEPLDGLLNYRTALRLAALFHDAGKAVTATKEEGGRIRFLGHDKTGAALAARRLRALNLSNEAVAHIPSIVAGHMRPLYLVQSFGEDSQLTRRAVYRFFRHTHSAGLDIVVLSLADHLATHAGRGPLQQWRALLAVTRRLLDGYFEHHEQTVAPPRLLDGSELIAALDLQPGPQIGHLLRVIEEAQAAGEVSSREEALELAREQLGNGERGA